MPTASTTSDRVDANALLHVLTQYQRGDFTARMPVDRTGPAGKIYDTLNDIIEQNQKLTGELQRVSTVVGKAGHVRQRASMPGATGGGGPPTDAGDTPLDDNVEPTPGEGPAGGARAE